MKASDRMNLEQNQPFYKKVGRKYIPVTDPYAYAGLREGYWLIRVEPGRTSIREMVHPANAEIDAAIKEKEERIIPIIREICEARPKEKKISDEALVDWKKFIAKHGDEFSYLEYPSILDMAEKIIQKLIK